jgi:hypothetical protein
MNNAHFTLPLEVYQMRLVPDAPTSILLLTDYKKLSLKILWLLLRGQRRQEQFLNPEFVLLIL